MREFNTTDILLAGPIAAELEVFKRSLLDDFLVTVCESPEEAVNVMHNNVIRIVGYDAGDCGEAAERILRKIRNTFFQEPVQIIAFVSDTQKARTALEFGADDFLEKPFTDEELKSRFRSAIFRLRSQIRIIGERNFFKKAVKQEEELSSKILDQHLLLKEAFHNIEGINQELEKTNRKLQQVARFDILSGLMNRASIFNAMDTEIERSVRTHSPMSGIMMDIDNFKEINDKFGHLHGDHVIAEIGQRLKSLLRKYDLAGRYGGEEFFVILPNTNIQQAYLITERFRQQYGGEPIGIRR